MDFSALQQLLSSQNINNTNINNNNYHCEFKAGKCNISNNIVFFMIFIYNFILDYTR